MNLLLFGAPGSGKGAQSALLKQHYGFHHISTGDLFRKAKGTPLGLRAQDYMNQGKLVPDSIVIDMIKEELNKICFARKATDLILDGFPRTLAQAIALDSLLQDLKMPLNKTCSGQAEPAPRVLPFEKGSALGGFSTSKVRMKLRNANNTSINKVLYLKVPEKVLIQRLTGRRVAEKSGFVYHIHFHPPKKKDICDKTGERLIQRKDDTKEVVQERLKSYHQQTQPLLEYYLKKNLLLELKGDDSLEKVFSQIQRALGLK